MLSQVFNRLNPKKPTTDADEDELKDVVAAAARKSAPAADFMREVDDVMIQKRCSRTQAMSEARRQRARLVRQISGGLSESSLKVAPFQRNGVRRKVPSNRRTQLQVRVAWPSSSAARKSPGVLGMDRGGQASECPQTTTAARPYEALPCVGGAQLRHCVPSRPERGNCGPLSLNL